VELSDASLVVESGDPSKAEDGGHHQHHSDHRNIAAGGQNNEFKIVITVMIFVGIFGCQKSKILVKKLKVSPKTEKFPKN